MTKHVNTTMSHKQTYERKLRNLFQVCEVKCSEEEVHTWIDFKVICIRTNSLGWPTTRNQMKLKCR